MRQGDATVADTANLADTASARACAGDAHSAQQRVQRNSESTSGSWPNAGCFQ
jgi:hypothetical protein